MENEKIFELMTKMYAEMQKGFKKSDNRFDNLESDVGTIKSDIKKIGAKIDGDITPNIKALFDGYKQNSEQLTRIENNINVLSDKVDKHDIKIQVIEGGKEKNIK